MYYQNKLKKSLIAFVLVFLLVFGLFTILQFNFPENTIFPFLNNIIVCTLTGAIVSLVQAWVGYNGAKRECILVFYKNCMIYGKKITDLISKENTMLISEKKYAEIRELNAYFNDEMKFSYVSIDKTDSKDKVLSSVRDAYQVYFSYYKRCTLLEKTMLNAINAAERSSNSDTENLNALANAVSESYRDILSVHTDPKRQEMLSGGIRNLKTYLFG